MPKADTRNRRVATSHLPESIGPANCPIAAIAARFEELWREHDRIEDVPKPEDRRDDGRGAEQMLLFSAAETLKDMASYARARSLEGALFQIRLAADCIGDIKANEHTQDERDCLVDQAMRLLFSAIGPVRAIATGPLADVASRYMPAAHDPLLCFDRARGEAA
ncbi:MULTISPECIES: hypothetical protein [Rhodopseudomonas]|nr:MULTISPECIES: hypothetical protein [Rhodopseudomonas]MDF3810071.1 hypothetical protein [Rhodopseudomonas sp. BAL398]WOK18748.1 hypothetical protein RBJ75_04250 [Rhodopseudomonas sp. BAL398]